MITLEALNKADQVASAKPHSVGCGALKDSEIAWLILIVLESIQGEMRRSAFSIFTSGYCQKNIKLLCLP